MNRLPYDVSRCLGTLCVHREQCSRYNDQPNGVLLSYIDASTSLTSEPCSLFIKEQS